LMHAIGGSVMAYYQLARHLRAEQPVYAIENQVVLNSTARLCRTIGDMASSYIEAIRCVYPRGPLLLGGYSMGGLIAFEIARQLMADGSEVRFLALIDTATAVCDVPKSGSDYALSSHTLVMMMTVLSRGSGRAVSISEEELERLEP